MNFQKIAYSFFDLYAHYSRFKTVTRYGIRYALDLRESVDRGIFLLGWEPHTLNWLNAHLKSGDTVIEVGANVGAHSLTISSLVGSSGCLYAFEPTNYAFSKLNKNFQLNPIFLKNTNIFNLFDYLVFTRIDIHDDFCLNYFVI